MAMRNPREDDRSRRLAQSAEAWIAERQARAAAISDDELERMISIALEDVDQKRLLKELREFDQRRKSRSTAHVPHHPERDRSQSG
ncbi:MAG TPA: hypothetical protein VFY79_06750 [Dehalococcoidia bacterium]|nr:hypothetical protein [Dehalococcoidia bacterium]